MRFRTGAGRSSSEYVSGTTLALVPRTCTMERPYCADVAEIGWRRGETAAKTARHGQAAGPR